MAINTYADLQKSVATWLKRSNLADVIPDFIRLAEVRINRDLRVKQMTDSYTRTTDQHQIALPNTLLEMEKVSLNGTTLVYNGVGLVEPAYLNLRGNEYAIIGDSLYISRAYDGPQTLILNFYKRLEPLSATNTQNPVLSNFPNVYLYAALLEGTPYLKDDDRIGIWQAAYSEMVAGLNNAWESGKAGGGALVARAG